jgi:uncharacterized membrane protein
MSQPPDYPGTPSDPQGGNQNPPGYPPPPNYGAPPQPPNYGAPPPPPPPPPGYGPPPGGYNPPGPPPGPPPGRGPPPGYGAPPAPPPGYGAPPAGYPPQPGYGGQPGGQGKFSVGDAVSWSWNKFTANASALVVPVIGYLVAIGVIIGVMIGLVTAFSSSSTTTYTDSYGITSEQTTTSMGPIAIIVMVLGYILVFAVAIYMHAGLVTGALDIADGKPVSIGTFFKPRNLGPVILTALLMAVGAAVLSVACVIPGIIFGFVVQFAIHFVVDRSQSPIDAIKSSIATVRSDIGGSLLSALVQYAAVLIGEILCLIGLFAGIPVALLIQTYTYRKLSGGQVVPLDQPGYQPGPPGPQVA